MALETYSDLVTAIGTWSDRSDTGFTDSIPDFVRLAETRHKREIRIQEMIVRLPVTVDARFEDLPTGFLEGINFRLLTSPVTVLDYLTPYEMTRQRDESTGKPRYYTFGAQIEYDVTPSESYSGEIVYYAALNSIVSSSVNALLTRAPDVYLYGALVASAPFQMNDERTALWEALYVQARDELNKSHRALRKVGPLVSRVAGAIP